MDHGEVFVPVAGRLKLGFVFLDAQNRGNDRHQNAQRRIVDGTLVQPYGKEKRAKQQASDADDRDKEKHDSFRQVVQPAQLFPVLLAY